MEVRRLETPNAEVPEGSVREGDAEHPIDKATFARAVDPGHRLESNNV